MTGAHLGNCLRRWGKAAASVKGANHYITVIGTHCFIKTLDDAAHLIDDLWVDDIESVVAMYGMNAVVPMWEPRAAPHPNDYDEEVTVWRY